MTRTLKPNGKGHQVLAFLAQGPALMDDIWRAAGIHHTEGQKQRKCVYLVTALRDGGLVSHDGAWRITQSGLRALDVLNAGRIITFIGPAPLRHDARPAA